MHMNLFGSIFCWLFITRGSALDPKWQFRGILPVAGSVKLSELTRASIELKIPSLCTTREGVAVAAVLKRPTTTTAEVGVYTMSPQEVINWIASTKKSANMGRYLAPVKSLLEGGLKWIGEIKKINDEEIDKCDVDILKEMRKSITERKSVVENWKQLTLSSIQKEIWWDMDTNQFLNSYVENIYKRIHTEFSLLETSFELISPILDDDDCATSLWFLFSTKDLHKGLVTVQGIESKGAKLEKKFIKEFEDAMSGAIPVLEEDFGRICHFEKINKTEIFSKISNCNR